MVPINHHPLLDQTWEVLESLNRHAVLIPLSAGIAFEIRQILTPVNGLSTLLFEQLSSTSTAYAAMGRLSVDALYIADQFIDNHHLSGQKSRETTEVDLIQKGQSFVRDMSKLLGVIHQIELNLMVLKEECRDIEDTERFVHLMHEELRRGQTLLREVLRLGSGQNHDETV